jgi:cyclophilin family peptidyl-prolyl cis-trans isomerase
VPNTARNFAEICSGVNGISTLTGSPLSYKNSVFYSITDQMAYGGDINNNDGNGGESIYGQYFAKENFKLRHEKAYLLSMTNSGDD